MSKGVFVGEFSESDIRNNVDKKKLHEVQEATGLKYNNTTFVKKNGKIVGMKVWACSLEDCELFK